MDLYTYSCLKFFARNILGLLAIQHLQFANARITNGDPKNQSQECLHANRGSGF